MFRKQSFWKGSALLLASAMIAKLLGACFKIPLTNVLGGTGMGYFSTCLLYTSPSPRDRG